MRSDVLPYQKSIIRGAVLEYTESVSFWGEGEDVEITFREHGGSLQVILRKNQAEYRYTIYPVLNEQNIRYLTKIATMHVLDHADPEFITQYNTLRTHDRPIRE